MEKDTIFFKIVLAIFFSFLIIGCTNNEQSSNQMKEEKITGSFKADYEFLKEYSKDLVLLASGKSMLLVSPALQGRVMTSSANGMQGKSFGWINKEHYKSGKINPQINVYGGEERFWLGPEGGQYSIFFEAGKEFTFENWATPKLIDLDTFKVLTQSKDSIAFTKTASLKNYADFTFEIKIDRTVKILSESEILSVLELASLGNVKGMGYRTKNILKNEGKVAWTKENGLLSIWLLGMFKHSESTTVVIPYNYEENESTNNPVNVYESFGLLDNDRLIAKNGFVYFKGDGKYRSKIGISPQKAKDILGSYDQENGILTLVKYNKPSGITDYVNSKWELQEFPYGGDVINSYNDGPTPDGAPLGPFYELETSSPAAALQPNEEITHIQSTFHFEGDKEQLNAITKATLGISLDDISNAFQ